MGAAVKKMRYAKWFLTFMYEHLFMYICKHIYTFQLPTNSPMNGSVLSHNHRADNNLINGTNERDGIVAPHTNSTVSAIPEIPVTHSTYAMSNGTVDQSDDEYGDPVDMNIDITETMQHNSEMLKQIQATVLRMNADLVAVNQRMNSLEKLLNDMRTTVAQKATNQSRGRNYPKWWPFADISPLWFTLLVLWPFVIGRLSRAVTAPRRK